MTTTMLLSELSERGVSLSVNGDKLRVYNKAALTDDLRQALKKYKAELLEQLGDQVPQSFRDRPCARCGSHEARKRDDGRWLCVCYFAPQETAIAPIRHKEKLPEWLIIDSYGWKKLLATGTSLDELMERRAIGLQQLAATKEAR